MATGDAIDRIYGGAVSFGRDVFHYIVTGTVFVLVCSVPLWPVLWKLAAANFKPGIGSTGIQGVALFVALAVLFCIGHVFLAVGFCIRKCWKKVFCNRKHVSEYKDAVSRIKNLNCGQAWLVEERDVHLGAEISVFIGKPDLHARFVERYNTLWHLRLGLAASLLCAGVIGPAVGFWWGNCHMLNICVGVVAFLSGVVLMRQHLVTNTSFLNRVTAAYEIVQQEAQKPDTRQS